MGRTDDGEGAAGGGGERAGEETGNCWPDGEGLSGEEGEETAMGVLMRREGEDAGVAGEGFSRTRYSVRPRR